VLISEVMTAGVEYVGPDDSVQEAARKMKRLDIGPLPVCQNENVVGMVTDRDITVRAVAEGRDPKATKVRDVMSGELICCYDDQEAEVAARLMQSQQIRRILVLNRDKRLVGIVSLADLAVQALNHDRAGEVLQEVSETGPRA
jgi:CBS domain-containing protein